MIILVSTEPNPSKPSTVKCGNDQTTTILTRAEILQRISKKRFSITGDMVEFPPLNSFVDLSPWIARVEESLRDVIPRSQWADAAILYLADYDALNKSMRQQRKRRIETGRDIWIWEDFQESLFQVLSKVSNSNNSTFRSRLLHILTNSFSRGKRSAAPLLKRHIIFGI